MRTILLLCTFMLSNVFSATFSVIGPCSSEPLLVEEIHLEQTQDAGSVTVELLTAKNIPFVGSSVGISSIFNTPTGLDAMEVLSDTEMNAYGWCFSVNGIQPEKYPDDVQVKAGDEIVWWYGYAHYLEGEWLSQCEPSHLRKSPQFCD